MSTLVLTGVCTRCGDCCRSVEVWFPASGEPAYDADYRRWLALHEGVRVIEEEGGYTLALPLRCRHLYDDPCDGRSRCLIYDERPQLCRDWPFSPADLVKLPRCSLRYIAKPEEDEAE